MGSPTVNTDIETSTVTISGSGDVTLPALSTLSAPGITTGSMTIQPSSVSVVNGQGLVSVLIANSGNIAGNTTASKLACWDSTGAAAIYCGASGAKGVIGIVYSQTTIVVLGTNYFFSQIVRMGTTLCLFDAAPMVGHYVVASTSSAPACADGGASYPAGKQPLGIALSSGTGMGNPSYVFVMNDMLTTGSAVAGLGTPNTYSNTAGSQNFALASSLITPTSASAAPTTGGSIAYDSSNFRYSFGSDGETVIPVVSPIGSVGLYSGVDMICAHGGDTGCQNAGDATLTPHLFKSHVGVPAGFLANPGKSIRVTYHLDANSTTGTPPPLTFYLVWNGGSTTSTIFQGVPATPPASMAGQQFSISCLITATSAPSTTSSLYANCTSGALGSVTTASGFTLSVTAIPANALARSAIPTNVDTVDTGEYFDLAISYSANTSGNSVTILDVLPEYLQ